MELWVRSQDKKAILIITTLEIHSKQIFTYDVALNAIVLGKYVNEERALEVLDEIQDRLLGRHILYKMPRE